MNYLKDILEALKDYIEKCGINPALADKIVLAILLVLILLPVVKLFYSCIVWLLLKRNQRILSRDLTPYYSKSDVIRATKYYIPSKYQNVAPSEDDEPGRKYIAAAKQKLLPLFLNKVFSFHPSDNKYYLILADTGMGKTTFIINLYIRYKNKFSLFKNKLNIRLIPLGAPNAFEKIKEIKDKEKTILLLDAFDEDIKAVDRHKERMLELLNIVNEYKYVLITCRTQFFPSEEEEPYRTGYYTFGDSGREYTFQKLYLSVFDENDVKKYLRKRFKVPFVGKYKKAKKIADKSPNLVVRPLLLSHINELIDSNKTFEYAFQVYEALIERWIIREANKPGMIEKYKSANNYKSLLYNFSQELAVDLYINRKKRGGYFISKDEKIDVDFGMQINDLENDYSMTETEKKSKSLLNRNSNGLYKFSHKSIFEYFLALRLINNIRFYSKFQFDGMDAAKNFFNEMSLVTLKNLDGKYYIHESKGLLINTVNSALDNIFHSPLPKLQSFTVDQRSKPHTILITSFRNNKPSSVFACLLSSDKLRRIGLYGMKELELLKELFIIINFYKIMLKGNIKSVDIDNNPYSYSNPTYKHIVSNPSQEFTTEEIDVILNNITNLNILKIPISFITQVISKNKQIISFKDYTIVSKILVGGLRKTFYLSNYKYRSDKKELNIQQHIARINDLQKYFVMHGIELLYALIDNYISKNPEIDINSIFKFYDELADSVDIFSKFNPKCEMEIMA